MKKLLILSSAAQVVVAAMQPVPARFEKVEIWLLAFTLPTISRFARLTLASPA